MNKVSNIILSTDWPEVFEHPIVRAEHKKYYKRVVPSEASDLRYDLGVQHGWQEAFEFFMDTLPKRVARDVQEEQRRQATSLESSTTTTGLPEN